MVLAPATRQQRLESTLHQRNDSGAEAAAQGIGGKAAVHPRWSQRGRHVRD